MVFQKFLHNNNYFYITSDIDSRGLKTNFKMLSLLLLLLLLLITCSYSADTQQNYEIQENYVIMLSCSISVLQLDLIQQTHGTMSCSSGGL